jgi:general secretion pathway protein E
LHRAPCRHHLERRSSESNQSLNEHSAHAGVYMSADTAESFARYLLSKHRIAPNPAARADPFENEVSRNSLRKLSGLTELSANELADEVAQFYQLPRVNLPQLLSATALVAQFAHRFLRDMMTFPYRNAEGEIRLAITDPNDRACVQAAEIVLGGPITVEIASFEDIATALAERLGDDDVSSQDGEEAAPGRVDDDIESLRDLASGAPVVRGVNELLEKAMELRASDIHIAPSRAGLVVRMRIDGLLRVVPAPSDALPQAVISRIKILAGLNIAERRLPQDGAARLRVAKSDLDIRVAIMPTQHGESAVIRLLPRDRGLLAIDKLGLSAADRARLGRLIGLPHGIIVVTGPTGSGKTTTLATILSMLNEPTRKILTIEDPVEYEIAGIDQTQIKPSIGLTFASALRAFVRQDPDVIMIGEVRDGETAHIAIHAALTGHLVLTTLHTETAAAAVPCLLDLGVEAFLLKSTLRAVIAQRLVRQLCDHCKIQRTLTPNDLALDPRYGALGLAAGNSVYEPGSCERCGGTGYRGRVGAFELLELTPGIRNLINERTDSVTIDEAAIAAGMTTMIDDGAAKCRVGVTSAAEVLCVTTVR